MLNIHLFNKCFLMYKRLKHNNMPRVKWVYKWEIFIYNHDHDLYCIYFTFVWIFKRFFLYRSLTWEHLQSVCNCALQSLGWLYRYAGRHLVKGYFKYLHTGVWNLRSWFLIDHAIWKFYIIIWRTFRYFEIEWYPEIFWEFWFLYPVFDCKICAWNSLQGRPAILHKIGS